MRERGRGSREQNTLTVKAVSWMGSLLVVQQHFTFHSFLFINFGHLHRVDKAFSFINISTFFFFVGIYFKFKMSFNTSNSLVQ